MKPFTPEDFAELLRIFKEHAMTKHLYPRVWKHNSSDGFGLIQDSCVSPVYFTRNGHKTAFVTDSAFDVEAAMERSALTPFYTETFDNHVAGLDHAIVAEVREWFGVTGDSPVTRDAARLAVSLAATAQARKDLGVKTSEYHAQNVLLLDAVKKEKLADLRCQEAMKSRDEVHAKNLQLAADISYLKQCNAKQTEHLLDIGRLALDFKPSECVDNLKQHVAATSKELRQLRASNVTLNGMNNNQCDTIRKQRADIGERDERIARLNQELDQLRYSILDVPGCEGWTDVCTKTMVSSLAAKHTSTERKYRALKNALGTHGCDNSLKEIKRLQDNVVCPRVLEAIDGIRKSLDIYTISDAVAKIEDLKSRERTPESMKRAERLKDAADNAADIETAVSRAEQAFKQLKAVDESLREYFGAATCSEIKDRIRSLEFIKTELRNFYRHAQPIPGQDLQQRIEAAEGRIRVLQRAVRLGSG